MWLNLQSLLSECPKVLKNPDMGGGTLLSVSFNLLKEDTAIVLIQATAFNLPLHWTVISSHVKAWNYAPGLGLDASSKISHSL